MRANVINEGDIALFLQDLAEGQEPLGAFLIIALKRAILAEGRFLRPLTSYPDNPPAWLSRETFEKGTFSKFDPALTAGSQDSLHHIRDWIKGAIVEGDAWISDVDAAGRPKRLLQIGSIVRAHAMADKDMREKANLLHKKFAHVATLIEENERAGHIRTVKTFDNGYRVVQLLSRESLDMESAQMSHCIGNGAYDKKLEAQKHKFFSLRDPMNCSHATFEVEDGVVVQFKGKGNAPPVERYVGMGVDFIREQGWGILSDPGRTSLVNQDGVLVSVRDFFSKEFSWKGDLNLLEAQSIKNLPRGHVEGTTNLWNSRHLVSLGKGFSTGSTLYLNDCTGLTHLPDDLRVGRTASLENCTALVSCGKKTYVGGSMLLTQCKSLISLGEYLYVGGDLVIDDCTSLKHLPKKMVVKRRILWDDETYDCSKEGGMEAFRAAFEKLHPPEENNAARVAGIAPLPPQIF